MCKHGCSQPLQVKINLINPYLYGVLTQFESNILKKELFNKQEPLLLAFSSGPDSVVLAHLLHRLGYTFTLAHCNFKLRGHDSDKDEAFARQFAKSLGIPCLVTYPEVLSHSTTNKISVQMAARELRYRWFDELVSKQGFVRVLTAHHLNDSIETFFINLTRGSGLRGLKGIAEQRLPYVRPMLEFTKHDILTYASEHHLDFRNDKSNASDDYERNVIRHHIVPQFLNLKPSFEQVMKQNLQHLSDEFAMLHAYVKEKEDWLRVTQVGSELALNIQRLRSEPFASTLLHHFLSEFGFNKSQEQSLLKSIHSLHFTGKKFSSSTHELHLDRTLLLVTKKKPESDATIYIHSLKELKRFSVLKVTKVKTVSTGQDSALFISPDKLSFPMQWRAMKNGDKFKPFGMKGFKLLSDFCKDKKMSTPDKRALRLLVNGNGDILWVAGLRSDERYRVHSGDASILKIHCRG